MDGSAFATKPGTLFSEDFDLPEAAAEPEVIEPAFSASELSAARDAAWQDGHAAGLREANEADAAATRRAIEAIASQLGGECEAAALRAEQAAEAIARLLLDSLAATFPLLCAQYGDAEVRGVVRAVLPALMQEPAITLQAHPRTVTAVVGEVARLDPDLAMRVRTSECEAMPQGNVRVTWRNGSAVRNAAALWQQVAEILMPMGLLHAETTIEETIDGG